MGMPGINLDSLITAVGYPGLFAIIFAETGLLIGFFLPGDTLLITTGVLIQRGHLSMAGQSGLWFVIPLLIAAAVAGDAVGYQIGRNLGPRLFSRPDSRFFKRDHLDRAKAFYDRHGGKTIVAARFLAFIRTFAPTIAGAVGMPYHRFFIYNFTGAVLWVPLLVLFGYFVGSVIPNLEVVLTALVVGALAFSLAPAAYHAWREHRKRDRRPAEEPQ
jgi:membrane-associated protein